MFDTSKLTLERKQLHNRIISSFIDQVKPPSIDNSLEALFLVGIPGSGKSTYVSSLPKNKFVNLDLDEIKRQLPEYEEQKHEKGELHWEAIYLNNVIFNTAFCRQLNIIQNGTGMVKSVYIKRLNKLSMAGYTTQVIYFKINAKEAIKRVRQRARETDRRVISALDIKEMSKSLPEFFESYKRLADSFLII